MTAKTAAGAVVASLRRAFTVAVLGASLVVGCGSTNTAYFASRG